MSNLVKAIEIKIVKFNSIDLIGIKSGDKIFTSIKKICDDLGLDSSTQFKKIKDNQILNKGMVIMPIPTEGGKQDTLCLDIDILPFWMATIKPKKVKESIRPYLVDFQLKVVEILKNAFLQYEGMKKEPSRTAQLLPSNYIEALKALVSSEEQKLLLTAKIEKDGPKVKAFDNFMSSSNALDFESVAKSFPSSWNFGRNKLFEFCRNKGLLMSNNMPYQKYVDCSFFEVITISFNKGDKVTNTTKTLITPKGQVYIMDLIKKDKQLKIKGINE